jgi:hypothetical protein
VSANENRATISDSSSLYAFLNLPAGTREVRAEKEGFRRFESRVELRAKEVARVDASLKIGEVSSEVQVTATVPTITTEVATITNTRNPEEVQALPVNFRAGSTNPIFSSVSFAANVQTDSGGTNSSLVGGMPFMATSTVDGVSNINVRNGSIQTEMFPSADTIAEIKINSTVNNAEFAQAGDISVATGSGGNDFHRGVYSYHQNGASDVRNFFATGVPFSVANDFGVTASEPSWESVLSFWAATKGSAF